MDAFCVGISWVILFTEAGNKIYSREWDQCSTP